MGSAVMALPVFFFNKLPVKCAVVKRGRYDIINNNRERGMA
jgi:hypothetical protein